MNRITKMVLTAAAACVILGGIIIAAVAFRTDGQWDKLNMYTAGLERQAYTYPGASLTGLVISEHTGNVKIVPSKDGDVHITCWEGEKQYYDRELSASGILSVSAENDMAWYDYISFGIRTEERGLTVEVPAELSGSVELKIATGDIEMSGIKADGGIKAKSASGSVRISDAAAPAGMTVDVKTGDIALTRVSAAGDVQLEVMTGDITAEEITSKSISAVVSTGSIGVSSSDIGNAELQSKTGSIGLDGVACADAVLSAKTGDIKALITGSEGDYDIEADAKTGRVRAPRHTGGKYALEAYTATGDIEISFTE